MPQPGVPQRRLQRVAQRMAEVEQPAPIAPRSGSSSTTRIFAATAPDHHRRQRFGVAGEEAIEIALDPRQQLEVEQRRHLDHLDQAGGAARRARAWPAARCRRPPAPAGETPRPCSCPPAGRSRSCRRSRRRPAPAASVGTCATSMPRRKQAATNPPRSHRLPPPSASNRLSRLPPAGASRSTAGSRPRGSWPLRRRALRGDGRAAAARRRRVDRRAVKRAHARRRQHEQRAAGAEGGEVAGRFAQRAGADQHRVLDRLARPEALDEGARARPRWRLPLLLAARGGTRMPSSESCSGSTGDGACIIRSHRRGGLGERDHVADARRRRRAASPAGRARARCRRAAARRSGSASSRKPNRSRASSAAMPRRRNTRSCSSGSWIRIEPPASSTPLSTMS